MDYLKYEKLIAKLARKYSHNEETLEEMMSIGREAFCKTLLIYDNQKAAFITILYRTASCAMIDEYRKHRKYENDISLDMIMDLEDVNSHFSNMIPADFSADPARLIELSSDMANLSKDSQAILRVVFDHTDEIFMEAKSLAPTYLRGALTSILRKKDFPWNRITSCFHEIQMAVATIGA